MKNALIREYARKNNVHLWEVANQIGIADTTLSKWLRRQLPSEKEAEILHAIKVLGEGRGIDG